MKQKHAIQLHLTGHTVRDGSNSLDSISDQHTWHTVNCHGDESANSRVILNNIGRLQMVKMHCDALFVSNL